MTIELSEYVIDAIANAVVKKMQEPKTDTWSIKEVANTLEKHGLIREQEPCEDCISREAVDDYIAKLMSGYLYDEERTRLEEFSAYLWELPSVKQEPKTGRWIEHIEPNDAEPFVLWLCENCGTVERRKTPYCPCCGAKMESEGER